MLVSSSKRTIPHVVEAYVYYVFCVKSKIYTVDIESGAIESGTLKEHYRMGTLDIFGLVILTYAFGIAFGYYLARIFFGV